MSYEIVSGYQLTLLIGACLPPSTPEHLPDPEEALNLFPGRDPVVLVDLNTDIGRLRNPWYQQVAEFLASFVLVDLLDHFQQCLPYCNLQTWWQVRQG